MIRHCLTFLVIFQYLFFLIFCDLFTCVQYFTDFKLYIFHILACLNLECVLKSAVGLGESWALPEVVCIFFGQSLGGTANLSLLKLISRDFLGLCWYCEFKPQKIAGRTGWVYQFKYRGTFFPSSPYHQGTGVQTSLLSLLWPGFSFYQSLRPSFLVSLFFCDGLFLLVDALSWASFLSMVHKIIINNNIYEKLRTFHFKLCSVFFVLFLILGCKSLNIVLML